MSQSDDLYRISTAAGSMTTALKSLSKNKSLESFTNLTSKLAKMSTFMAGLGGAFGVASAAFAILNPQDSDTAKILKAISETQQLIRNQTSVILSSIEKLEDEIKLAIQAESIKDSIHNLDGLLYQVGLLSSPTDGAKAERDVKKLADDPNTRIQINSYFDSIYDRFNQLRINNSKSYFETLRDATDGDVEIITQATSTFLYYAMMAKFLYEIMAKYAGYSYESVHDKSMEFYDKIRNMADVSMYILRDIERNIDQYVNKRFVRSYNEFVQNGGSNEEFASTLLQDLSSNYPFLDFVVGVYDKSNGFDNHCVHSKLPCILNWSTNRPTLADTLDSRKHNVFVTWTEKTDLTITDETGWSQQDRDDFMREMQRLSQQSAQPGNLFSQQFSQMFRRVGSTAGMLPLGKESMDWTMQKALWYPYQFIREDNGRFDIRTKNILGDGNNKVYMLQVLADDTWNYHQETVNGHISGNLEAIVKMVSEVVPADSLFYGVNSDNNYLNLSLKYTNPKRVKYARGSDWGLIGVR